MRAKSQSENTSKSQVSPPPLPTSQPPPLEDEYEEIDYLSTGAHKAVLSLPLGKMEIKRGDGRHCDLCGCSSPKVRCEKCANQIFCLSCDDMYHRHPKRQTHVRKALDSRVQSVRPPLPPKGEAAQPPLPPPRKNRKPGFVTPLLSRKDFSTSRLAVFATPLLGRKEMPQQNSTPSLPRKEFSFMEKMGSLKRFMVSRPLPTTPDNKAQATIPPPKSPSPALVRKFTPIGILKKSSPSPSFNDRSQTLPRTSSGISLSSSQDESNISGMTGPPNLPNFKEPLKQLDDGRYPEWDDDPMNMRQRSSSITGLNSPTQDWNFNPGYPRPTAMPVGYPPRRGMDPPTPMNRPHQMIASASAWDLSSNMNPLPIQPNRGLPMQQAQSMAQLNWNSGMWPPGPEFGWDYPPPMMGQGNFIEGNMKRTPSTLSIPGPPGERGPVMGMWGPPMLPPGHYPHPLFAPYHPMSAAMMYAGSQGHLAGPMPPLGMARPNATAYDNRAPSPASSHRSRRSQKSHRSHRSSQKQRHGSTSGSSTRPKNDQWSDSEDERFSEDSDSGEDRSRPSRNVSMNKYKDGPKSYGRLASYTKNDPQSWECDHCTFVNEAKTRICAVCCRTSSTTGQQADPTMEEKPSEKMDDNLPVVKSNLTFKIKEDLTNDSITVQTQQENLAHEDIDTVDIHDSDRDHQDINKHYEDVNNMLKRLQMRKEERQKKEAIYEGIHLSSTNQEGKNNGKALQTSSKTLPLASKENKNQTTTSPNKNPTSTKISTGVGDYQVNQPKQKEPATQSAVPAANGLATLKTLIAKAAAGTLNKSSNGQRNNASVITSETAMTASEMKTISDKVANVSQKIETGKNLLQPNVKPTEKEKESATVQKTNASTVQIPLAAAAQHEVTHPSPIPSRASNHNQTENVSLSQQQLVTINQNGSHVQNKGLGSHLPSGSGNVTTNNKELVKAILTTIPVPTVASVATSATKSDVEKTKDQTLANVNPGTNMMLESPIMKTIVAKEKATVTASGTSCATSTTEDLKENDYWEQEKQKMQKTASYQTFHGGIQNKKSVVSKSTSPPPQTAATQTYEAVSLTSTKLSAPETTKLGGLSMGQHSPPKLKRTLSLNRTSNEKPKDTESVRSMNLYPSFVERRKFFSGSTQSLHLSASVSRESSPPRANINERFSGSLSDMERSLSPDLELSLPHAEHRSYRKTYDSDYADQRFGRHYAADYHRSERHPYGAMEVRRPYYEQHRDRFHRELGRDEPYGELEFKQRRHGPDYAFDKFGRERDREWTGDFQRYYAPNDSRRSSIRRQTSDSGSSVDSYRKAYPSSRYNNSSEMYMRNKRELSPGTEARALEQQPLSRGYSERTTKESVDLTEHQVTTKKMVAKANYASSLEEFIARRKKETTKNDPVEEQLPSVSLEALLREANQCGFDAEHLQIALSLCGDRQPVSWLQDNWLNMVDTVVTLATNYGQERVDNDIGTLSRHEASLALRLHQGNIWASVTECVEQRRKKFTELMIRGKGHFTREDIVTALTAHEGDTDKAWAELCRPPEELNGQQSTDNEEIPPVLHQSNEEVHHATSSSPTEFIDALSQPESPMNEPDLPEQLEILESPSPENTHHLTWLGKDDKVTEPTTDHGVELVDMEPLKDPVPPAISSETLQEKQEIPVEMRNAIHLVDPSDPPLDVLAVTQLEDEPLEMLLEMISGTDDAALVQDMMQSLEQDLNRIVQMSEDLEQVIAAQNTDQQQLDREMMIQDEILVDKNPEIPCVSAAVDNVMDEDVPIQPGDDVEENIVDIEHDDDVEPTVDRDPIPIESVPMALEEDDDDLNDIDYIDEEDIDDMEEDQNEIEKNRYLEEFVDVGDPMTTDHEANIHDVLDKPLDIHSTLKAPAVRAISAKLSQIMNKESSSPNTAAAAYERKVRQLLAEGRATCYEKAELAARLMDLKFEEEESIYAAHECSSLYMAISYLQQDCELCANKYPVKEMVSMLHCIHRCCKGCARIYFSTQIRDRSIMDAVCPFCRMPDLTDEDIAQDYFNHLDILLKNIVTPDIHELFQRKLRDRTLTKDPNFRWCTHCSSGYIANPRQKRHICPDCRAVTCALCRKPWEKQHEGISCEQFAQWKEANDAEYQAEGLAKHLAENGIRCPQCQIQFALTRGGCMHFTCTQCKYEFCSGCGKEFRMGARCQVGPYCAKLGLHAHHPRNCLFYLRDQDPAALQKLLTDHGIDFLRDAASQGVVHKKCTVQIQKETPLGFVDDICANDVENDFAGLCRQHYIEYLVKLINQHKIDPLTVYDGSEYIAELRRMAMDIPERLEHETDADFYGRCAQVIRDKLPLE